MLMWTGVGKAQEALILHKELQATKECSEWDRQTDTQTHTHTHTQCITTNEKGGHAFERTRRGIYGNLEKGKKQET